MRKNVASQTIGAQLINASDGSNYTGSSSVFVTVDGGTQSAGGTVTHEGNGYHSYTPTQAETNGDHIAFTFTGTGAVSATVQVYTNFPQTVDNNTLLTTINDNVDVAVSTRLATSGYTAPNNAGITANGNAIAALNDFNPESDTVANVTTVQTTVTNSDMRGTNNALLASNYTAPDNATISDTNTKVTSIQSDYSTFNSSTDQVTVQTNNDKTGYSISGTITTLDGLNNISAQDVLSAGDIDTYSLEESQKLILAASAGVLSGAATNSITIQAADNSKPRIIATVDADGNRTAVTKDATS